MMKDDTLRGEWSSLLLAVCARSSQAQLQLFAKLALIGGEGTSASCAMLARSTHELQKQGDNRHAGVISHVACG